MQQTYEYDFVRLVKSQKSKYQEIVKERANDGWRLVQIFQKGQTISNSNYELIFEKELD